MQTPQTRLEVDYTKVKPEAMLVLGAETDDNLVYYWANGQDIPPGPL
jgi:hypothetical protein